VFLRNVSERVAIVLGAGGAVGHGFHAGVLAALHDYAGFDAREAGLIVGTSAGAGVGALLRARLSGPELMARVCGHPLSTSAQAIARCFRRPGDARTNARSWRPAKASYLLHALARPWRTSLGRVIAALLPPGPVDALDYAAGIRELFPGGWPRDHLWIPAVRLRDGAVVAFGRESSPSIDVGTAVAASSAVPGVWAPVAIDGETYVDGGMASVLHLALAAELPRIDRVLISSPLSRMPLMRTLLRRQIRMLHRHGLSVELLEPGPRTIAAMGWNPLDVRRAAAVADAAYQEIRKRPL
jgi:NTE family protein